MVESPRAHNHYKWARIRKLGGNTRPFIKFIHVRLRTAMVMALVICVASPHVWIIYAKSEWMQFGWVRCLSHRKRISVTTYQISMLCTTNTVQCPTSSNLWAKQRNAIYACYSILCRIIRATNMNGSRNRKLATPNTVTIMCGALENLMSWAGGCRQIIG